MKIFDAHNWLKLNDLHAFMGEDSPKRIFGLLGLAPRADESVDAVPGQEFCQCQKDQDEVQPDRRMSHILFSQPKLVGQDPLEVLLFWIDGLGKDGGLVAVFERCPISDAWAHAQNRFVVVSKQFDIFADFGPWAHETHVPQQHIEQLRKFVKF